ncbi:hypothetical protein V7S43_008357 [Phytophthora oleae]|uniref:Uncharacterized protein n=1 Tax=Phytophthora oleae TaxID=2107226 RepID=A0ABD3FK82_9STRA
MSNTATAQSDSDGTSMIPESAELPVDKGASEYTLYIGVHRLRTVVGILVMVIVVIGAMLPFARDGVRIETFQADDMDAAKQKKMLDKYNSISGGLTVLLSKPLDVFLSMVVSVTVLCLATKCSVHHENQRRYLVMEVIGIVGYLMNTGFSALNVQVVSGGVHPRIISSDLTVENGYDSTQQLDDQGLLTTTWSKNFRENMPGNSVRNTILRTLFAETEEVPTWCNQSDDYPNPFKNVMATYGFPSRSWQQYALSKALEPTATLSMPMNAAASSPRQDQDLPMNESIAINLAVYAMLVSNSFFGWWKVDDEAWNSFTQVNYT